jgi:hypothetical protein
MHLFVMCMHAHSHMQVHMQKQQYTSMQTNTCQSLQPLFYPSATTLRMTLCRDVFLRTLINKPFFPHCTDQDRRTCPYAPVAAALPSPFSREKKRETARQVVRL